MLAVAEMGNRLATIDMGRKKGAPLPFEGELGSPSNIMWPEPRYTSLPSGSLIHPIVWPQHTNVTDRTDSDRQTDNGSIANGRPIKMSASDEADCSRDVVHQ